MTQAKWRLAHASVVGAAHISQNTVCQDRFLCRQIETAAGVVLIAAVADGAGSTNDGQHGAEIACKVFVEQTAEFLRSADASVESLTEEFGKRLLAYIREKITAVAAAEKKPLREFAATLVGAVAGESGTAFYQIGDGAAVFSATGGAESYRFGIEPAESEYVNLTDFVTDETAGERLRFAFVEEEVEDLILFSDGIFPVAVNYQTMKPHEPFLMPMIAPLGNGRGIEGINEKLENFLASPKINEKTDDDKTIILASRRKAESRT